MPLKISEKSSVADFCPDAWMRVVFALAIFITLVRVYLSAHLGLGDDEAYYWDWTRQLSLSYYDHPAMTAWLIKVGTLIFGATPLGVRLPNLICNLLSTVFLFEIARDLFGDVRVAWNAVFLYLFAPIFVLGGLLMVPDSPMSLAWMSFSWALWKIYNGDEKSPRFNLRFRLWVFAGLAMGFGILSKYTIVLLALSSIVFLFSSSRGRGFFSTRGFWTAIFIACVCALPILIWNAHYDWPSLKYHLHERQTGGGGANSTRLMQYFITQLIALGPALYLACLATLVVAFRRIADARWRFIALLSSPPLFIFTVQALFAEFKPHWPAPAYPLLIIGFAELWREGFGFASLRTVRGTKIVFGILTLAFLIPVNLVFHVGAVVPILPKLARAYDPEFNWDPKFDPTNDLYGWEAVASEIRNLQAQAIARGEAKPFVSSSRYQLVAQLAFATGEKVFRVSSGRDQYSFSQTAEVMQPLNGQNSIFVVDQRFDRDPNTDRVFASCAEQAPLIYLRGSEASHEFHIWLCRNFHAN